jgi:hypothetical protein
VVRAERERREINERRGRAAAFCGEQQYLAGSAGSGFASRVGAAFP